MELLVKIVKTHAWSMRQTRIALISGIIFRFFVLGVAVIIPGCTSGAKDIAAPVVLPTLNSLEVSPEANSTKTTPLFKQETVAEQTAALEELSVREQQGQTVLQLRLSKPISQYRHFPLTQPSRIVLDITTDSKGRGDAEVFRIDSSWVGMLRIGSSEGSLRMTLDVAGATVPPYLITPEGEGLKITVGDVDVNATARRQATLIQGGKRTDIRTAEVMPGTKNGKAQTLSERSGKIVQKYTGQKMSLDFKDADIKNVFRLLAEVSGLNIIVTGDVNKKVTLRLVEVPWDQALDLIIDTNGLGKEHIGNVVRISTAGQLKSETDAVAAAKRAATSAKAELEPLQTAYLTLNYSKAKEIELKIKPLLTKRGAVVVDERTNTILVRDINESIEDVNALVSKLDARTPQVLIESNLIETTPTFARALGLRLQFDRGGTTFSTAAGAGTPFAGNTAAFPGAPSGLGGTISVIQNSVGALRNLSGALEAAEKEGNIKIISRPSVVTLNNVPSTIQSLRIIRISLPTSTNIATGTGAAAGAAVATEKVNVGIVLTVTPQVSADGFVLMNIAVKSSSIADSATASGGGVIPFDELSREAVSNVLVRDGETIVIGGIMKDTQSTSESGVPYLKDIPVLGWLFKGVRVQSDFEELMVFITPRIVSAGSASLPNAENLWREHMKKTVGDQSTVHSFSP